MGYRQQKQTRGERLMDRFFDGGWKYFPIPVLLLVVLLIMFLTGNSGMIEVQPGRAAVVCDTLGAKECKPNLQQGTLTFMPFLTVVELVNMEPQILYMEGQGKGPNRVPRLTVRAKDGSKFWFEKVEIHYQILPGEADALLANHGLGDEYMHEPLPPHAREVLRNEFGRFSFLEIADPSNYNVAKVAAMQILNERLNPLGISVTQIILPKPSFAETVEQDIEARQAAEQSVDVQVVKRNSLIAERDRKVQAVTQEQNAIHQGLIGTLESDRKASENAAVAVKREADKYRIETEAQCLATRDATVKAAEANEEAYRKKAEGIAARIQALGSQGEEVLYQRIAENVIPQVKAVSARPYAHAPSPTDLRVIHTQAATLSQ